MFDLRIVPCTTQVERRIVNDWIQAQPDHSACEVTPGSSLYAIRSGNDIVGAFELRNVTLLSSVFAYDKSVHKTSKAFEAMMHAVDSGGIDPVIECRETSPLFKYAKKLFRQVWKTSCFFNR